MDFLLKLLVICIYTWVIVELIKSIHPRKKECTLAKDMLWYIQTMQEMGRSSKTILKKIKQVLTQ